MGLLQSQKKTQVKTTLNIIRVTTQVEIDALPERVDANLEIDLENAECGVREILGHLFIRDSAKLNSLTSVSGHLYVDSSAKLDAPQLTSVGGDLRVYGSAKLNAPQLTSVGNDLRVDGSAKLDAPQLTSVGGDLRVYDSAKLNASQLTSVGGNLYVDSSAKLDAPQLTSVGGDLRVYGSAKLNAPQLTSVGNDLRVDDSAKLNAPQLTSVGGHLYVYGSVKLDALTSVGGYLYVDSSAKLDAPQLTSVGNYIRVYGSAKLDAPQLTSVGGHLYVDGSANLPENTKFNDVNAEQMATSLKVEIGISVRKSFLLNGFLFADGILGKILSKKQLGSIIVYNLAIKAGLKTIYCVQSGNNFSHSETIKEAVGDLQYKISDRDTSEYKSWNEETVVSKSEMIMAYRKITGACEIGAKDFVESNSKKIKNFVSVAEAISITQGRYGHDLFKAFFSEYCHE